MAIFPFQLQGQTFTQAICEEMVHISKKSNKLAKPLIFALSNPTSKAECTAQQVLSKIAININFIDYRTDIQAYSWTDGECIYASGSPFDPVTLVIKGTGESKTFIPGQGNNAYIFPGVGLGAIAIGASSLTDEDFYVAAACLVKIYV